MSIWVRTCQECGLKQIATPPPAKMTSAWEERKCQSCKSSGLDYGSSDYHVVDGKLVRNEEESDHGS